MDIRTSRCKNGPCLTSSIVHRIMAKSASTRQGDRRIVVTANGNSNSAQLKSWQVYIIRCSDDSLYTGITTDIDRRFTEHATGKGARYFRGRQPVEVVYLENCHTRSSASKRESLIKALSRVEKVCLLSHRVDPP